MSLSSQVAVRGLSAADVPASASLHGQMADIQFIARGGPRLLRPYYRSWMSTSAALALGAFDDGDGVLVGVLLGCTDPGAHYQEMLRAGGRATALGMALAALTRPAFARELVTTRALRYTRGLLRRLTGRPRPTTGEGTSRPDQGAAVPGPRSAEITHLVVDRAHRGSGAGRALVGEAVARARQAGCLQVQLVALPGSGAAAFYEHLGFRPDGELRSGSGEEFLRFVLDL